MLIKSTVRLIPNATFENKSTIKPAQYIIQMVCCCRTHDSLFKSQPEFFFIYFLWTCHTDPLIGCAESRILNCIRKKKTKKFAIKMGSNLRARKIIRLKSNGKTFKIIHGRFFLVKRRRWQRRAMINHHTCGVINLRCELEIERERERENVKCAKWIVATA